MRKPINNAMKNLISFAILIVALLCTFIVGLVVNGRFPTATENANIRLKENGNVYLNLTVSNTDLTDAQKQNFNAFFSEYVTRLNLQSNDTDFITIKDIDKTPSGYNVKIETRRIDKIHGVGDAFLYGKGSNFCDVEANVDEIVALNGGKIRKSALAREYPDHEARVWTLRATDNSVRVRPMKANSTDYEDVDDFEKYLKATNDKILLFRLFDTSFISKITLNISGKIKYVSSQGVKLLSNNQVEITPIELNASYRVLDSESDVNVEINDTVKAFYGYIVFDEAMSPVSLAFLLMAGELVVWFTVSGICLQWFKTFFHSLTWRKMCKYKAMYLILLPGLICLIIFHYLPMFGLTTAFQDYSLTEGIASEWVGFKYFYRIFTANTPYVYRIFRNTIFISLLRIASNFPIILLFALFVNSIKNTRVKSMVQTVSFIPYFLSWAAVAGLLYAIISDYGLLNSLLIKLGFVTKGVNEPSWYSNENAWWTILSVSSLWKGMGWGTLIYISAMCNIDEELYEACALDGGGVFRKMITVTIPGIMPMICMQLILDSSSIMKDNYEQILALINGATGLQNKLQVIGQISFDALSSGSGSSFGSATTYGLIQGVIGLMLVFISNRIVKKTDNPGII